MSARTDDIQSAIEEAERFLKRAKAWLAIAKNDKDDRFSIYSSPTRAAMLRSSLDLTRALARMRRRN